LVENLGINPEKVGMYGGSYGGFITLSGATKNATKTPTTLLVTVGRP
jgi:dipeptidyl aminopeptidase/acylaminoacyl peptidase